MIFRLFLYCGAAIAVFAGPWDPMPMQAPGSTGAPPVPVGVPGLIQQQPPRPFPETRIQSSPAAPIATGGAAQPAGAPQMRPVPRSAPSTGPAVTTLPEKLEPILPPPRVVRRTAPPPPKPTEPMPLVGAAPARLVFSVDKEGRSSKPQSVVLWSEQEPLGQFVMNADAPWLTIEPKRMVEKSRRFEVSVRPERLGPGTHSTAIIVAAGDKRVLTIPVTVEVVGKP